MVCLTWWQGEDPLHQNRRHAWPGEAVMWRRPGHTAEVRLLHAQRSSLALEPLWRHICWFPWLVPVWGFEGSEGVAYYPYYCVWAALCRSNYFIPTWTLIVINSSSYTDHPTLTTDNDNHAVIIKLWSSYTNHYILITDSDNHTQITDIVIHRSPLIIIYWLLWSLYVYPWHF